MHNKNTTILVGIILCLAVLTSGCTINVNVNDDNEDESNNQEDTTTSKVEQDQPVQKPQKAPQTSIRGSRVSEGLKLEHQGGDNINLAEIRLVISSSGYSETFDPLSNSDQMFIPGDIIIMDFNSESFKLNGQILDTTINPSGSLSGGANIKIYHIPTNQMIADLSVN